MNWLAPLLVVKSRDGSFIGQPAYNTMYIALMLELIAYCVPN